jgi:hypothetical protein
MARPKKSVSRSWAPSQAVFILERALKDRKLSAADIKRYVGTMADEIRELEERLASLKDAAVKSVKRVFARGAEVPVPHVKARLPRKGRKRAKSVVSAERRASQQLQGQYLGLIRQIPKTKRAFYQKVSKAKGREEAIAAMKKALGK